MKELFNGILTLIGAIVVSVFMYSIGTLYSLCYSIWLTVTMRKWYAFFTFWLRLVDGFAAVLGNILQELAYSLDLGWNVNGEMIEDAITTEENTTFSSKNISVSASVGKLQVEGKLNKFGLKFSKLLNKVFHQKNHAVDSWNFLQARNEIRKQYFNK